MFEEMHVINYFFMHLINYFCYLMLLGVKLWVSLMVPGKHYII